MWKGREGEMSEVPGWNPNVPAAQPEVRVRLSFADGVRFGLGLAVAWLVLVPVAVVVILFVLART